MSKYTLAEQGDFIFLKKDKEFIGRFTDTEIAEENKKFFEQKDRGGKTNVKVKKVVRHKKKDRKQSVKKGESLF